MSAFQGCMRGTSLSCGTLRGGSRGLIQDLSVGKRKGQGFIKGVKGLCLWWVHMWGMEVELHRRRDGSLLRSSYEYHALGADLSEHLCSLLNYNTWAAA